MRSKPVLLRNQLLKWLLVPLSLLLTADVFISYSIALNFAQRAYDRALIEIAREASLHLRTINGALEFDLPEAARRVLFEDPSDHVYYEIGTPDGNVISGQPIIPYSGGGEVQADQAIYDGTMEGLPVRIVELRFHAAPGQRAAVIRVAETKRKRTELAREILLSVVVPQVLLIMIAGAAVWIGVVRGLTPLARLQQAVASRSHRDLSPIEVAEVPEEVRPVMDSINALLERLKSVLTLQGRFIADAAHQLKTPVAGLLAELELALREHDPVRIRESMEKLHSGLTRLARAVSQLLSLARNEPEGVRSIMLEPLDLNALALEAASSWVPPALKKGIDLGFEGRDAPLMVRGDATRLRELFDNLLDNAVRYTRDSGRVTVRVSASPQPTVAVSDDGPAIPGDERARVFERFHRVLGSAKDGSGLGLAIAQEIARIHGAEIQLCEDADGIGNTFSVVFPLSPPSAKGPL